jgi:hypothetical protein
MKTKICLIAIACLLSTGSLFATSEYSTFKERTGSWLQRSDASPQSGRIGDGDEPTEDPTVGTPVGDSAMWICLLSGGYLFFLNRKKRAKE